MEIMQEFLLKFQITENNPFEKITKEAYLKNVEICEPEYFCYSEEIGEEGTFHIHIYMRLKSRKRFTSLKKFFPRAHIEAVKGSSAENRDYVFKIGKWENSDKAETNIKDSHIEFGDCPLDDKQGKRNDLYDLLTCVKEGMTNAEIVEYNPKLCTKLADMDRVRSALLEAKYRSTLRNIYCTYVYGATGTGKTRGIFEKHGFEKVYRVTDYKNPFDGYQCEPVIVFEEFRSQVKIEDMLNLLDIYPLSLPCRYANKQACFEFVYIVSNWSLAQQYANVQRDNNATYKAFLRRIHEVTHHIGINHKVSELSKLEFS